jgi:PiT family inorganic phosphate transporter
LSIEVAVARLELGGVKSDGVLTSIILPSIAAPLVAGFVAGVGTWLVFRIVAGVPEARRDEGFRWG